MVYQPIHQRKVIGRRLHKTLDEHVQEREEYNGREEVYLNQAHEQEFEFLVPCMDKLVETDEIKKLIERVSHWVDLGYPPHIIGPTGCGKTTLALAAASRTGRPTLWINGDDQMTTSDLIGGYSEIETSSVRDRFVHNVMINKDRTKYTWVDNPLTIACKYGYTLVYNEFSRSKPIANNILLSVLEEGILELPIMFGTERYIDVHPDFNMIFTSNNIEYAGIHTPQDALLDRLIHIFIDYYDLETEASIVVKHTDIPYEDAEKIVKVIRLIRDRMPPASKPSTRAEVMISYGMQNLDKYNFEDMQTIYLDVLGSKIREMKEYDAFRDIVRAAIKNVYGGF